jgi:hypothetical protein
MQASNYENMYVIYIKKEIIKKSNITYMPALNHNNTYIIYRKNRNEKEK